MADSTDLTADLKSVSFHPISPPTAEQRQTPYEAIDEADLRRRRSRLRPVTLQPIYDLGGDPAMTLPCDAGSCAPAEYRWEAP